MDLLVNEGNKWLMARLKEPSTWKGLAILAGVAGWNIAPEMLTQIGTIVGAVIGAIEVGRKGP